MLFYESPLKIEFDDDGLLVDGQKKEYSVRMLSDLNEVLMEPVHFKENKPIYLMYREVYKKNNLRYDITVIASRILGKEYARTYGHHHPIAEKELTYPEIYQVLFGEARFVLQKRNNDESTDVLIVSAKKGDVVLIPPGYGHVTVNPSEENPLFLSNLVSSNFSSDYEIYKQKRGPAVYHTIYGPKQNTNYMIKKLENTTPDKLNKHYGFSCEDIFTEFYKDPNKFEFLNKPSLLFG